MLQNSMLSLRKLSVSVGEKQILQGVSLSVRPGEMHVLMGPNGSGKSTLAQVIAGNLKFRVTGGAVTFGTVDLLAKKPDERARLGLFVSFQQPLAISGVPVLQFFRVALDQRNNERLRPSHVRQRLTKTLSQVGLAEATVERELNVGFSGGEQKRFELAQLLVLGAKVAVLDEIDSGLDVDGIRQIADAIERIRQQGTGILYITHNPQTLSYLKPDAVHVLVAGKLVASGGTELGQKIARDGYKSWIPA